MRPSVRPSVLQHCLRRRSSILKRGADDRNTLTLRPHNSRSHTSPKHPTLSSGADRYSRRLLYLVSFWKPGLADAAPRRLTHLRSERNNPRSDWDGSPGSFVALTSDSGTLSAAGSPTAGPSDAPRSDLALRPSSAIPTLSAAQHRGELTVPSCAPLRDHPARHGSDQQCCMWRALLGAGVHQ